MGINEIPGRRTLSREMLCGICPSVCSMPEMMCALNYLCLLIIWWTGTGIRYRERSQSRTEIRPDSKQESRDVRYLKGSGTGNRNKGSKIRKGRNPDAKIHRTLSEYHHRTIISDKIYDARMYDSMWLFLCRRYVLQSINNRPNRIEIT